MSKVKRYAPKLDKDNSIKAMKTSFPYVFLAPMFMAVVISLITLEIKDFIANLIAFGMFFGTAKANSIGLKQEFEYYSKKLTKAPKTPYKLIAGVGLGVSTFFSAYVAGGLGLVVSIFLGSVSSIGYFLHYGFDPRVDKLENIGDISAEFVLETLSTARGKLKSIEEDMGRIEDNLLNSKLKVATDKAYEIVRNIEDDPKDIRVARKFLIVYIDGIKRVTKSYVEMKESDITDDTKERLYALLGDVEKRFDREIERLKKNNQFNLDVHIDVLQEQIKN
jgi:5-bromo-4-chloroindolyl phosphate hydrolysis protein